MSGWWPQLLLVMAGGALGAGGRFALGGWLTRMAGSDWPWGTFAVNLLGSLLAGVLLAWLEPRGPAAAPWRAFLMVGVLGGFTTWSALVLELHLLGHARGPQWSGLYVVASLLGSVLLFALGLKAARHLFT